MLSLFDFLRDMSLLSVAVRMLLAVVCGGIIGLEREYKRRPAGFRTHILICLGAAMTTLTSQYLLLEMHYFTDIARLGAQVVAGVGFIGAGTIIVTKRQRVKGLTTAAGLWVSAIIGLTLGAGFYEAGILTAILILIAELLFSKIEYRMVDKAWEITLYIEYSDRDCLDSLFALFQELGVKVISSEVMSLAGGSSDDGCAVFSIRLSRRVKADQLIQETELIEGVCSVGEL